MGIITAGIMGITGIIARIIASIIASTATVMAVITRRGTDVIITGK